MKVTFGYQYSDFEPDKIEKKEDEVNLEKALELFNDFPWNKEFDKLSKRHESNMSSSIPTIYFYFTEITYLSISASDDEGFLIYFQHENKFGQLFISNNYFEKVENISVEQFIEDFFNKKIIDSLKLFKIIPESKELVCFTTSYNKDQVYRPLLFMLLPFLYLLIDRDDLLKSALMILLMAGLIFILILPNLLLKINYWKNDSSQSISYNPVQKLITIKKNNKTYEILKSEIESFDLVFAGSFPEAFKDYTYLRFKTNNETFVVTHLTVDPRELLSLLNVNFRYIEMFYPKLEF